MASASAPVTFTFLFEREKEAQRAAAMLRKEGYLVTAEPIEGLGDWRVQALRHMPWPHGRDLQQSMEVLARQYGGAFLGLEQP